MTQGVARYSRIPQPYLNCDGNLPCPRTGIWFGRMNEDHPQAALYNRWDRQVYLSEGQVFPDPEDLKLGIEPHEVHWLWMDNANQAGPSGFADVTLSDLHGTGSRDA